MWQKVSLHMDILRMYAYVHMYIYVHNICDVADWMFVRIRHKKEKEVVQTTVTKQAHHNSQTDMFCQPSQSSGNLDAMTDKYVHLYMLIICYGYDYVCKYMNMYVSMHAQYFAKKFVNIYEWIVTLHE